MKNTVFVIRFTMITTSSHHPLPEKLTSLPWVRDALRALARYKWRGIAVFVITMALVTAVLIVYPATYASEARLLVRVGRESVTLDPTATSATSEMITVNDSRESEINSVLDVIESRVIVEQVVDDLGPGEISTGLTTSPRDRELAIVSLQHAIKVTHAKKSNVISILCKSRSPELAQKIAQTFLDVFHVRHMRVNRTVGSYDFFVKQSDLLNEQLMAATRELSDAKNALGLISIDGHQKFIQDQLASIESSKLNTETSLAASEAMVASLRATLKKIPERQLTEEVTGFPNGAIDVTRQQLYQFRIREQELLSKYTKDHPLVVTNREQAEAAEKILKQQKSQSAQSTSSTNPSYQELELNLFTEETNLASLRATAALQKDQTERLRKQLQTLNDEEGRISQLQRHVELLQTNHRNYAEKLEQARIDQVLETERISNVNVVQHPTFVSKPVSPKRGLILAAGLVFATMGGLGIILLSECISRAVQHENRSKTTLTPDVVRQHPAGAPVP